MRTSAAALRADRRRRGLCAFCDRPSVTYRCPVHAIRQGQIPTVRTPQSVTHDQWRRDGNGWERFRGKGRRGAPTAAANDEADLIEATKALEKGRTALAYAHSPEVKQLGPIQRRAALEAAAAVLRHAAGFVLDVVRRHGPVADAAYTAECNAADAEIEAADRPPARAARR
jgi:hypothetical protein